MGKKTPKAPAAPDPNAVAAAQTQSNKETAISNAYLNRINQYTPEGSLEFTQTGTNPDGTPKFESRQTYSPGQQQLYDNETAVSNAMSNLSLSNIGRVGEAQKNPFTYDGMTPIQTGINQPYVAQGYNPGGGVQTGYNQGQASTGYGSGGNIQQSFNGGPGAQYGYDAGGQIQSGYDAGGQQRTSYDAGGNIQRGYDLGGNIQDSYASGGNVARGYDAGGNIQQSYGSGGNVQRDYASGGNIQDKFNFDNLTALPGAGDYGAEAKRVQDAVYNQATSRLDPRMEQEQRQLASTLAAKGVTENSAAYRNAMDQFTRQKTDAYNQATYSGIQAGGQEQSRLFGLSMQGRQQGASEAMAQGQFGNTAQAQREQQNAARAGFGNQAQSQVEQQNAARAAFGNQAQGQQNQQNYNAAMFGNQAQGQVEQQNAARAAFGNQSQAQRNQQNAALAGFGNTAQNQQNQQNLQAFQGANSAQSEQNRQNAAQGAFGNLAQAQRNQQNQQAFTGYNQAAAQNYQQNQGMAAFSNEAQNQQNQQNMQAGQFYNQGIQQNNQYSQDQAQFYNQAQGQQNNQNMQQAAFGNQAAGQIFGMNQNNASFNNQARQQQIQEALALRNQPLNEVAALMGQAGGVSTPQFAQYSNANVAGTDYSGIMQQGFANQQALYQQQMAARNSGIGSIFGALGGIGSAAIMSDRRVKHDIVEVGELPNGLKTYAFSYNGSEVRHFGVMADEVLNIIPDAVVANDNGYMAVDYGKVWSYGS